MHTLSENVLRGASNVDSTVGFNKVHPRLVSQPGASRSTRCCSHDLPAVAQTLLRWYHRSAAATWALTVAKRNRQVSSAARSMTLGAAMRVRVLTSESRRQEAPSRTAPGRQRSKRVEYSFDLDDCTIRVQVFFWLVALQKVALSLNV